MCSGGQDNSQWLSVTEETLFLHDGLIRVTDLVELPRDVNSAHDVDHEVVSFDSKSPVDLSERLRTVCGTHNNAYSRLLEYRLNALRGLWGAQHQLALEEQHERDSAAHEETIALLKKQGLWKETEQASFSTRVSLLLCLPLLQSQSRLDPELCGVTAELLLNVLRDCAPLSLTKEPADCLNGLESLLSSWLGEKEGSDVLEEGVTDVNQRENCASALVALTCARGHLQTFLHTVHLLQRLENLGPLPVGDILQKLLDMDGGQGQPTAILGSKHIVCWGLEDMLSTSDSEQAMAAAAAAASAPSSGQATTPSGGDKEKSSESESGRSITCDGKFLYCTSSTCGGIVKIGTGLHGTLRGYAYVRDTQAPAGWLAWGDGVLLHRPHDFDKESEHANMLRVLDTQTLKCLKVVPWPEQYVPDGPFTTIALCSDGKYFYYLSYPATLQEKSNKGMNLYIDTFRFDVKEQVVIPLRGRVILQRKEETTPKSVNDSLLSRLRPYRSSGAAANLVVLGGAEPQAKKDDSTSSCGLPLKTLIRAPIFCDGQTVVILTSVPGGSNNSAARSLFGSGAGLSTFRSLATNLCFNLDDGQFISRSDLIDASTCSIARGASIQGLGVCCDVFNNMIWTCSNDWVDQYYSPGHQARHHIIDRLGITPATPPSTPQDAPLPVCEVVARLLQHVGSMCLHQLNSDLLHTPLGTFLLHQHPVDVTYLQRVLDVLNKAMSDSNRPIIICCLIILQLIFKMSVFKCEKERERDLISRTSTLVWRIISDYSKADLNGNTEDLAIEREVCGAICAGLNILYASPAERNGLLHRLLTDGNQVPALTYLRDLILNDFSEKLRNQSYELSEVRQLRLSDELVHYILKIAVRESCVLLRECQTTDMEHFERILSSVPMASPCLRYLIALTSHLLREGVLYKEQTSDSDEPQSPGQNKESLEEVQALVLRLASRVFGGAYEVLEVLLETCNYIINSTPEDMEQRLAGLERVTKATILGHLLPVLLTSMTHRSFRCLAIADNLMPQLVQLVVLTSQAALLLKSQVQAIQNDDLADLSTDVDIVELIGEAITTGSLELEEKEEQGFLAGLKIPAPWATGKTVESIHPVRDNYKFKETIHIPGARCLYLRFDPRCSSQYDYDKLVIYAAPNTSSRKVAEFGGNTFGYGSRSVLGSGWPRDLLKVEGDTVTFTFEMRSGREHNTPDKAMWGFHVTVRAQESSEEVSGGLPFLADLALGLSVLACTMLQLLFHGPEKTRDEEICQHLLKSRLLQRCVWQEETAHGRFEMPMLMPEPFPIDEDTELKIPCSPSKKLLPRIRLPAEIIHKLRVMSERHPPQVRPSIKEVIKPEVLEESILSTIIKHMSLCDTVRHLASHEEHHTEEYFLLKEVISETYRRTYALIRQLQTLAELEQKWRNEVEDIAQNQLSMVDVFFLDYHLAENKLKELACLCFLKDIEIDVSNLEETVNTLREKFESDVALAADRHTDPKQIPKTSSVVSGLLERLSLLLHVTIAPEGGFGLKRSMSQMPEAQKPIPSVMVRSDTDVLRMAPSYTRSFSAPTDGTADDSVIEIIRLQRKRQAARKGPASVLHDLVEDECSDRPPHVILLEQLFSFIGSSPEKAVSCESFLNAACIRWRRGNTRQQALIHMKELLTAASRVGGATHLVAAVTSVLQHGPKIDELTCGGVANKVREAFAETMTSVVQLAARYPIACCNSIGLLCIIPYTRAEEKCLVRCGLVHLLDHLCSLTNQRSTTGPSDGSGGSTDAISTRQRVSAMAWAGFQVLSNRCVMWEQEDGAVVDDLEHSGLARQVSTLLSNHLTRATECSGNEAAGNEALQEVLSLLNNLSRSKMGKAILSQPGCVSKLLSLLLDQRPSPKLVLIILQLCRVALPLMSADDCDKVELPTWGQSITDTLTLDMHMSIKPFKIASLLLAKLGDFLVPGGQTTLSSRRTSLDGLGSGQGGDKDKEDTDVQDGRLSVFVHKREDQTFNEVIQPLLSSDSRPFRLGGGSSMERFVKMEREITKSGRAEVITEDAVNALRKAAKWAQIGLVVSTGPPVESTTTDSSSTDKKKTAVEVICKEKNAELARTDPIRPFISGHVANSMAAEVIALLHSLLSARETLAAHTWANAVEKVVSHALSSLPLLLNSVEDVGSPHSHQGQLMALAKQANAALAALGGFEEMIKPGCQVEISGPGIESSPAVVSSVSEQTGLATVSLLPPSGDDFQPPRYSDTVQVPISRLKPPRNEPLPLHQLSMTEVIVTAVQSLLLPQHGPGSPLAQSLPIHGADGNTLANQICRVVAEVRTRACQVLAGHLRDITFASAFIQHSSASIDILKSLAKDCSSGERECVVKAECQRLRMLYRDCAKPPPPPSKTQTRPAKEITWDTSRLFPPVRCCLFSHGVTAVTFLGDPSCGSGYPRGTIVYASQPVPQQAPSFYWELEICSFGDQQDDSGLAISFGFMPAAEKRDGAWTNPVGSCLFHNTGRAVHYNGSSLLQWKSARLDVTLNSGDVAGIGWESQGNDAAPQLPGQNVKGVVFFTHNGRRLPATLDDVSGGMWPVVHVQKKQTRVKANFGARPFAYAEGRQHRNAADDCHDPIQEIREEFGALLFYMGSDSESEGATGTGSSATSDSGRDNSLPTGPPCKVAAIPKALREYKLENSLQYKLASCYENFATSGPDLQTQQANADDESDVDDNDSDEPLEDHNALLRALLVKAWEQKVFPTIRRRFRNEAERKDGLEQIRGALQLGMTDIARQTVEFLYEENGGMPRDLNLPTIDDIEEELAKFTIERVRKGTSVVIRTAPGGSSTLPKFAVRAMLKTFGLTGVVLDIDQPNELVQVETYLRSEGVLVRYWYPLDMLERPPQGYRKASLIGNQALDTANIQIDRELLRVESLLARMHCRTALLELISQCNSPAMEVPTCSTGLGSAMAASAALLQELDIENLQLLSNELLSPPQPHGCVVASSLLTSSQPWQSIASNTCALSDIFYSDTERLKVELKVAIARAADQGEDYLIELSNQICQCLQTAPETFQYEEFPVNETKVNTDIYFPGAAFLVVSCKTDPKYAKKETSLYKSPWARVFTYRGHRIKKTGQLSRQEVVSYPRDRTSASTSAYQYAPAIIPADLVHVRLGVSPPPGVIVTIHAIPAQFPLAAAHIETLISIRLPSGGDSSTDKQSEPKEVTSPWRYYANITISPAVYTHVIELLSGYLWRSDIPAMMKEYLFHLLAQSLRRLHGSEEGIGSLLPPLTQPFSPSLGLLMQLQSELRHLYDEETKLWASSTTASGAGMGLGVGDSGRFSTYFHSLMEVSLAAAERSAPITPGGLSGLSAVTESSSGATVPPTSPLSSGKRKKLKAKRDRDRAASGKRSGSPMRPVSEGSPSGSASSTSVPPSASSSSTSTGSAASGSSSSSSNVALASSKPEDMLWFHRAVTMSQILRHLTRGDSQGEGVTNDAIADAVQALSTPTAHTRILVINGIPGNLSEDTVRTALTKAAQANGGLYKNELYIPTQLPSKEEATATSSEVAESVPDNDNEQAKSDNANTAPSPTSEPAICGYAVMELCTKNKVDSCRKFLSKSKLLLDGLISSDELLEIPEEMLLVTTVNQSLLTEAPANAALESYLLNKLVTNPQTCELTDATMIALTEIFHSCFISEQRSGIGVEHHESGYICLGREQIMTPLPGNLLHTFFNSIRMVKKTFGEQVHQILRKYGVSKLADKEESDRSKTSKTTKKPSGKVSKEKLAMATTSTSKPPVREREKKPRPASEKTAQEETKESKSTVSTAKVTKETTKEEEKWLTLDGLLSYVVDKCKQDVRMVWRGLLACGFDLHFERCACIDTAQALQLSSVWNMDMDCALVKFVNEYCQHLAVSPARIHPHEIYLTAAQLASVDYSCLQGIPNESIQLRFALLQSLNNTLETFFLPLVDLRPTLSKTFTDSSAALLAEARGLIFYDTKIVLLNRILNATAQRKPDQAAPEIVLDPLESVSGEKKTAMNSNFCQALRQLATVPSNQLNVRLAAGGDPMYSFNVRMLGEEVHGTSGSFRHFLWHVARELESSVLNLLIPCPSSATHKNRGKYLLKPGPMTFAEEKLLQFFGQLLGITLRADIPLGLDLLPVFWKVLVGQEIDPIIDLQEADVLTYTYIKKFEMAESEDDLQMIVADNYPKFVYTTLTGQEHPLLNNGKNSLVNWNNRQQYVAAIRDLRLSELRFPDRLAALHSGLATVLPLQILPLMTATDLELRMCGRPEVDLQFLKAHTMYQVGLMETDTHILYFWRALEGFSQEELRKFIKFACNQERVPQTCPCRDGGADTAHVPPYPMKIAPPDGAGPPDRRFIRAETCMFMIKLPQYSSQTIMTERLLYAIHCREDPLSGDWKAVQEPF